MIYYDGYEIIIVWIRDIKSIKFETEKFESIKYKFKTMNADEWLKSENFKWIGLL